MFGASSYDVAGHLTHSGPSGALNADYVKDGGYDRAGNLVRTRVTSADGARAYGLVNANAGAT